MAKQGTKEIEKDALETMKIELQAIAKATKRLLDGPIENEVIFRIIAWKSGVRRSIVEDVMTTAGKIDKLVLVDTKKEKE